MPKTRTILAIDVGERRIGVAIADTSVRLAVPLDTIVVTDEINPVEEIVRYIAREQASVLVVGYPRNQQGEATAQTAYVEAFAKQLEYSVDTLVYQDESLTSVLAKERLESFGKPYKKEEVDAQAAAIILQDYLEQHA